MNSNARIHSSSAFWGRNRYSNGCKFLKLYSIYAVFGQSRKTILAIHSSNLKLTWRGGLNVFWAIMYQKHPFFQPIQNLLNSITCIILLRKVIKNLRYILKYYRNLVHGSDKASRSTPNKIILIPKSSNLPSHAHTHTFCNEMCGRQSRPQSAHVFVIRSNPKCICEYFIRQPLSPWCVYYTNIFRVSIKSNPHLIGLPRMQYDQMPQPPFVEAVFLIIIKLVHAHSTQLSLGWPGVELEQMFRIFHIGQVSPLEDFVIRRILPYNFT